MGSGGGERVVWGNSLQLAVGSLQLFNFCKLPTHN